MTARDRLVIIVVLVLVAIAASWVFVIQPKRDEASKLAAQVASAQQQVDGARSLVAQQEHARAMYKAETAELARLGEAVPADDDVPSLIYQLQHAANGARIDFLGVALSQSGTTTAAGAASTGATSSSALPPGVTVGTNGLPSEQFTFTFHGTYFQLTRFFNAVQRFVRVNDQSVFVSGRLLSLDAIDLVAARSGFPQISATISATTYLSSATGATPGSTSSPSTASSPSTGKASASSPSSASASASSGPVHAAVATPAAQ